MLKFETATGVSIEATRVGDGWDFHTHVHGRTIATVRKTDSEARELLADLRALSL